MTRSPTGYPAAALREAIDWHLALAEGDTDRWHEFVAWLEADEAHRAAYDRVSMDDALLDGRRASSAPVAMPVPAPRVRPAPRRIWAAGGIVALLAGATTLLALHHPSAPDRYRIESPASASRAITLADGSRIALNRGGRLLLDRADPRRVVLEQGEAMFQVRHDASSPFRVEVAGRTIEDVGTAFNVVADGARIEVAVAQGAVLYQPAGERVMLTPGMALRSPSPGAVELRRVAAASVGGWTSGRLEFDDVSIAEIARALGRSLGTPLRVAPSLGQRRISCVLRSDRGAEMAIRSLAALAGATATRQGDGWLLSTDGGGAG